MPITKQAIKRVRQDKRKTAFNMKLKKTYKGAVHDFRKNPTESGLKILQKALDKAAKTNVIHKNKAARLKSRLSKKIAKKTVAIAPKVSSKKKSAKK